MKKSEVKTGETYRVKVSGSIADVRITGENANGGWDGVNTSTNRKVRIKSAQRLRGPAGHPTKRKKVVSLAEYEADTKTPAAPSAKTPAKAAKDTKPAAKRRTGERRRPSGLDAAATVLAGAGGPLGCKDMVEQMLTKGLWQTKGATPASTIYAAIIREIAVKGADSRFRKTERGRFELAAKKGA